MKRSLQILLSICFLSLNIFSQQHTIMTYNLLNYPGSTAAIRNPHFITVLSNTEPDIIVAQEVISQSSVDEFLSDVLQQVSSDYVAGSFFNGPDTDNAIFFKTSLFTFITNNPIQTALRDINEFVLMHKATGDTIRIYSLHLKASQGSDNEQKRAAEIDSLRKVTDALHPAAHFIVTGDFNIYRSTEPAYQILLNQTNSGYVLDPIDTPGDWHNNFSFASIHTQSPRTRQFQGGANGGMDDRFDMMLVSQSISNSGGVSYVSDSYTAYGNDGNHFNDSINAPPNTAVGQEIADAIHYASDHIPIFANFSFNEQVPLSFQLTVSVDDGWNMVSAPGINPDGQGVDTWWSGNVGNVFKFSDGYQVVTTVAPGEGYWMKNLGANVYNTGDEWPVAGIQIVPHDPIPIHPGWNLIGVYECPVEASGLTTTPTGLIAGSIFGYQGGYLAANTLYPGYGYWLKSNGEGWLNIPPCSD